MKQKFNPILLGFILGIIFVGASLFLIAKAKPYLTKASRELDRQVAAHLPKAKETVLISDFENADDLKKWKSTNVSIELSTQHATSGKASAQINFQPSSGVSGVRIEDNFEKGKIPTNWSGFEVISFDIFNPGSQSERVILQIKDKKEKRQKINLRLQPNSNNHIEIPISQLHGAINTSQIIQLNLFLWENKQAKALYLDNIRLVPAVVLEGLKKNIQSQEFLPKKDEKIYATGDYFAFNNSKWLKTASENNGTFIELPLLIKNYSQADCKQLPVSGGVPFPRGELKSFDKVELIDGLKNTVPFQAKVLSRWPDQSIKWGLVTFKSNTPALKEERFFLRYGDSLMKQSFSAALAIEENAGTITVNTGPLKINLNRNSGYLFDKIWLDKNSDGAFNDSEAIFEKVDMVLVHNGIEYYSHLDKDYSLTLEEKGPARACIKAQGWFVSDKGEKFCRFVVRIYAYQGSSALKAQHTFIYTGYPENNLHYLYKEKNMPKNETIDAIYLRMPITVPEAVKFTFGVDNSIMQGDFAQDMQFLQKKHNSYEVVKGGQAINSGNRLKGWIDVSDSKIGVSLGIKNFWEQFPKGFTLDKQNKRLIISLWPKEAGELDFKTTPPAYGPGEFARGSAFGIAKTHDIFMYFHKGDYAASDAKNTIESLTSDVILTADPQWISDTRVLGKLLSYDTRVSGAEEFLSRLFDWGNRQISNFGWYGMVDFGDTLSWYRKEAYDKSYDEWGWHPEGRWGWFNCEAVGTHSGALIQFLRTGEYKYFVFGTNLSRHIMDIDTCHYNTVSQDKRLKGLVPDDYSQVGSMHRHNANHWGGRNDEASHTNVFGLILYFYLTGDGRARDVIDEVGNYFLSEKITYFHRPDIAPQRTIANVLWGDVSMYELTQDERYKKAADKWANVFYLGQRYDGSWGENYNPVAKRWDGKAHMGYIREYTLPALIAYHQLTGNKAIGDCIIKATDHVIKNEEYLGYFDASAYSYWLSGDKKYVENIKKRIEYTVKRQRKSIDPIWDGMFLEKAYYLRVMDLLYKMPYAFEILTDVN